MELSSVRTVAYVVIISGCFFFLYPKLFHPLVKTVFGIGETSDAKKKNDRPPMNPAGAQPEGKVPDNVRQHMRPGPHPGMRAAAENTNQKTKGSSSGRGMMGVILPMYAVGIIVYLVYTLFKVFNKKDPKSPRSGDYSDTQALQADSRDYYNKGDTQNEGRVSTPDQNGPAQIQSKLESLVAKAKDKDMTEDDMRLLQTRLAETESQMSKILAAMKSVQTRVEQTADDQLAQDRMAENLLKQEPTGTQSEEKQEPAKTENKAREGESSVDSNPNTDNFEIVGKSDKDNSSDSSPEVETIKPLTTDDIDENSKDSEDLKESSDKGDNSVNSKEDAEDKPAVDILLDDVKKEEECVDSNVRRRLTKTDAAADS